MTVRNPLFCARTCRAATKDAKAPPLEAIEDPRHERHQGEDERRTPPRTTAAP